MKKVYATPKLFVPPMKIILKNCQPCNLPPEETNGHPLEGGINVD